MALLASVDDYRRLQEKIDSLTETDRREVKAALAVSDRYYLLRYLLSTKDWPHPGYTDRQLLDHPWLLERCREAQSGIGRRVNIWARFHGKTTILTRGAIIQYLLAHPERSVGLFSQTRMIAEAMLFEIKTELEMNEELKTLFPDILWAEPQRECDRWGVSVGINVKGRTASATSSVEAWGLLDSNFQSRRFNWLHYDDIVNQSTVTTPEQNAKVVKMWELSLGTQIPGGEKDVAGTFYAFGDAHHSIVSKGYDLHLHPCYELTEESEFDPGTGLPLRLEHDPLRPVLYSREHLLELEKEMGPESFAIQLLCLDGDAPILMADWT
ncbi:MAG: hypothetical protein L0Z49_08900, partial [Actinobacteria bacterium]|nr:hypothetical protein [Actinomycetota bacterium]